MRKRDEVMAIFRGLGFDVEVVPNVRQTILVKGCYAVRIDFSRLTSDRPRIRALVYEGPYLTHSIKNKHGGVTTQPNLTNPLKPITKLQNPKFKVFSRSFLTLGDAKRFIEYMKADGLMDDYEGLMISTRDQEMHVQTANRALDRILGEIEEDDKSGLVAMGSFL